MDLLNEDKLMKQAKEIWEQAYKPFMKWDDYWFQVREQVKIYLAIPEKDKPKMMKMLNYRVDRTYRELQKEKIKRKI